MMEPEFITAETSDVEILLVFMRDFYEHENLTFDEQVARTALQQGDPDLAETLVNQAEKAGAGTSSWMQPWADTPAKVRRDIQTARKTGSAPPQVAAAG